MLQSMPYLSPVVSGHTTHVVVYSLPFPCSQWAHHPCCSVRLTCPRQLVDTPPMLQCTPYLSPVVSGHTTHVVVYTLPVPCCQWARPLCNSVRLTCPRQLVGTPPILQCMPYLSPVVSGHTTHVVVYALPVPGCAPHVVVYALPVPGSQWAHHPCCSVRLTCPRQLVDTPPLLQCTPYLSPGAPPPCCSVRLTCSRQLVGTPPMLQCTPYLSPVVSGHTTHVVVYALPVSCSQWAHPPCCSVRLTCPRQLMDTPPMLQCTPYLSPVVSGHTPPCCSVRLTCPRQLVDTPPMLQCTPYLSPVVSGHTTHVVVYALPVPGSQWVHHLFHSVRLTCPRQLVGTPPM